MIRRLLHLGTGKNGPNRPISTFPPCPVLPPVSCACAALVLNLTLLWNVHSLENVDIAAAGIPSLAKGIGMRDHVVALH